MINTFFSNGALGTPAAYMPALIIGALFGLCLEKGGFGSSRRLTGIFYFKDMVVFKVMFTAVITAMLGLQTLMYFGVIAEPSISLTPTMYGAHLFAGLMFGTGFAMGGWCPGTAAVGLVSGKWDALIFLGGVTLGSVLFNEMYSIAAPILKWGYVGVVHTYESLNIGQGLFVAIFAIGGIISLCVVEKFWPWRKSASFK